MLIKHIIIWFYNRGFKVFIEKKNEVQVQRTDLLNGATGKNFFL